MTNMFFSLKALLFTLLLLQLPVATAQTSEDQQRMKQFNDTVQNASEFLCSCLKPVYRILGSAKAQSERAIRIGDDAMLEKIRNRLQQGISLSQPCIGDLVRQFPSLDRSLLLQQRVLGAAEKQCPAPV